MEDHNFEILQRIEGKLDKHIEDSGDYRETLAVLDSQELDQRLKVLEARNYKRLGFIAAISGLGGGGVLTFLWQFIAPLVG